MISLVVAHGDNRVIGKDGWMPWNLPDDLKHFKETTLNKDIVMGRTTFEVMKKPLPKRHTYVITRDQNYSYDHENVTICNNLIALINKYNEESKDLYICGGAQIYTLALPYVDEMWISLVDEHYEGDTFFPDYSNENFIIQTKEKRNGFTLIHYIRKK